MEIIQFLTWTLNYLYLLLEINSFSFIFFTTMNQEFQAHLDQEEQVLSKPVRRKKKVLKQKRVAFQESSDREAGTSNQYPIESQKVPRLNLPPKHPNQMQGGGQIEVRKQLQRGNSRQSSVEDYDRYYQNEQRQQQQEIVSSADVHLQERSTRQQHQDPEHQRLPAEQQRISSLFEPQFIKNRKKPAQAFQQQSSEESEGNDLNWIAKPTKEGFLYFTIPGTNTYQWTFPKVYHHKHKQSQYLFISHWLKKEEPGRRKYWFHKDNKNYKQYVKPHAETYLIEAAIQGNLAFLEVYTKFKGDLSIRDQQGRSALMHAISNNHIHFVSNLCEYSKVFSDDRLNSSSLLELQDRHGNTPLFTAIRFDLPEVLQILISYKCNFFHQKRNGNTCLHDCAVYNAIDCLTMLASYCGRDLFQMFNKDGKRAVDVAIKLKNGQIMHALQKLERNMTYQNAVLERSRQNQKHVRDKGVLHHKEKAKVIKEESSLSSGSQESQRIAGRQMQKTRGRQIRRQSFSGSSQSESSASARNHLDRRQLVARKEVQRFDERKHFEFLNDQRKERKKKKAAKQSMSFRKYKEEYLKSEISSDEGPARKRRGTRTTREPDPSSRQQLPDSQEYFNQMRNQKAHQEQYFGEVSYLKPADIPQKNKSKSKIYRQDDHYVYSKEQDSEIIHQLDKSYFEVAGHNSSNIDIDAPSHEPRTERQPDFYNSRLHTHNNRTLDDIEKQRFRVTNDSTRRKSLPTAYFDGNLQSYRQQGQSMVEQAFINATKSMFTMASYIYTGYEKLKEYATIEYVRPRAQRSKSMTNDQHQRVQLEEFQNKYGPKGRRSSRTYRRESSDEEEKQRHRQDSSSVEDDDYQTAYGRSKSRAHSRRRSRSRPYRNQSIEKHIQIQTEIVEDVDTKSMGIQADSFVKQRKRVRTITRKTEISRHSIGVGSICIDQIDQTNQDVTIMTANKKKVVTQTHAVDMSRGSIASQKLQHSQLINFERGRRTVKKLGLKAQQILMESKHFQSSEDEQAIIEQSIKMSDKIEPQPHHMKEEIQYIKMAEAYEQRDAEEYRSQLQKMKEFEEEQSEKLKQSRQQSLIAKSAKSGMAILEDQEMVGKHQSTPTCQSTERQNSQGIQNTNHNQVQPTHAEDDIKDFYQKLLYSSLSQTDINVDQDSIALILEDQAIMNMLHEKFSNQKLTNQRKADKQATKADDSVIEFNHAECEHSLDHQDTLDLELGAGNGKFQKQEQRQYFVSDDADSLNFALQGSLLQPIENFGECLSDCTFILQERQSFLNDYGSKCNSNIFDKGQIIKPFGTMMNNSCCSQQPVENLSLHLQLNHNLHSSGFGVRGGHFETGDEQHMNEKLLKVVNQNIQAIPIPKPKKGQRKIKRRGMAGGSVYSAAASEWLVEESANNCLTPAKLDLGAEEKSRPNAFQIEPRVKSERSNKEKVNNKEESVSKSSSSSLKPGAMTQSSCEDETPKIDKALVVENSEIEVTIDDQSNIISPVVIARNTLAVAPAADPQLTPPNASADEVDVQVQLFKEHQNTKSSIVSTRYKEQQECSILEHSELQPKKVITTSDEDVFGKKKRPKATRGGECSRENKRELSRDNRDILSNIKELFGSSADAKQRQTKPMSRPTLDGPDAMNDNDHTKDLTKVDFDLTQLNQTSTPRPEGQQDVRTKERINNENQMLVQSNAKFLQDIAGKIEKELQGTKIEKRIEASREYSLSFDVSKDVGKDENTKQKEPTSDERQLSQQNPLQSFQYYEPMTSSDPEIKQRNSFYPSDQEQIKCKLIPKPRSTHGSERSGSQSSKGKFKLKIKKLSSSSKGTDIKKISDADKQEEFQGVDQFQQLAFGRAYTSSDDESKFDRNTAKFHPETNNSMQMETSNPMSPDLLRHSISSVKQAPTNSQSTATKALAAKLSKIKAPTLLRHKTVKEVSYKGSNTNLSQSNQHSIMTDNSERLRENLSQIRRQKEKKIQIKK